VIGMRASDADRDRVADALAEALAEGRLTADEHGARLDAAYAAKTCAELDAIVGDLPGVAARDRTIAAPRPPERRPWLLAVAAGLGGFVARLAGSGRSRRRDGIAADRAAVRRPQRQEIVAVRRDRNRAARELRRRGQWDRRTRRYPRRSR
jgi:Domain of unknown function (DUF1707)